MYRRSGNFRCKNVFVVCVIYNSHTPPDKVFTGFTLMSLLLCFSVPDPTVEVNISPFGAVTYAGNNVNLRCTATLTRVMIGTDVTVNTTRTKNGLSFSGISGRVTVHEEMVTPTIFYSQLQFSPLSSSMDNGTYFCNVTVTPVQQQFVIGASGTGSMALDVIGKYGIYAHVR